MAINIYFNILKLDITSLRRSFFICVIIFSNVTFSQNNETNNWFFGQYAGLNFNLPENPETIIGSNMYAPAGCSSISDKNGNLLFFTNSQKIWNKNFEVMSNGENILGNAGAAQNSIIIPILNQENLYYVFTTATDGFYYSKVNMSLNNGLGEVIESDIAILTGSEIGKVSAVHHNDGESIWVMTTKKK